MNYYIATRLSNHEKHNIVRDLLNALGHRITYDWTVHGPVWNKGIEKIRNTADREICGVIEADLLIVMLPGGRGTHVEYGAGLAQIYARSNYRIIFFPEDKRDLQIHPEMCAFHHHPRIEYVFDIDELLSRIRTN